ncbi:MAG: ABC transporter ATP-binding protein [bacterium]
MAKEFEFKNVIKTYKDFQLGPLNLSLEPGVVLGYIGPNGSGKTTTMHCLTGLVRADQGEMKVFGKPNSLHIPDWKLDIGYVGDVHVFYERWTGEKNLIFLSRFYPNWSEQRALELAERFQLPLHKRAKDLSSGNRVKLSLIGALAHSPRLLILDEPTAGLDPVVRTEVLDVLFEILESGERAIFYSTHILSDISRLADELAFWHNGQVFQRTAKDDLLDQWRKISFRLTEKKFEIKAVVSTIQEENEFQVISYDVNTTREQLREIGAENIQDNRMTIDEIAVQILKNNRK